MIRMITKEKALGIAKAWAIANDSGWDERYCEAAVMTLQGEPVWMVATSAITYSKALPWMIEEMPAPSYYYISMVEGKCIAVGSRQHEIQRVKA